MPVVTEVHNEEIHYTSLVNFVKRGELFAAFSNDRKEIVVNWGTSYGYPSGESFARVPIHHAKDLIAVITAVLATK